MNSTWTCELEEGEEEEEEEQILRNREQMKVGEKEGSGIRGFLINYPPPLEVCSDFAVLLPNPFSASSSSYTQEESLFLVGAKKAWGNLRTFKQRNSNPCLSG